MFSKIFQKQACTLYTIVAVDLYKNMHRIRHANRWKAQHSNVNYLYSRTLLSDQSQNVRSAWDDIIYFLLFFYCFLQHNLLPCIQNMPYSVIFHHVNLSLHFLCYFYLKYFPNLLKIAFLDFNQKLVQFRPKKQRLP